MKREVKARGTRPVSDMKHRRSVDESHPLHGAGMVDINSDEARVRFIRSVDNLIIVVSGGWGSGGAFCSLCPGWGGRGGLTVSKRVQFPGDSRL